MTDRHQMRMSRIERLDILDGLLPRMTGWQITTLLVIESYCAMRSTDRVTVTLGDIAPKEVFRAVKVLHEWGVLQIDPPEISSTRHTFSICWPRLRDFAALSTQDQAPSSETE